MIGMMYLVLTAMLALNVSADILNGFSKLRHSMEGSMASTAERNEDVFTNFENAFSKDGGADKYGPWYDIAKAVRESSDSFFNYIDNFKIDIINQIENKHYAYGTPMSEIQVSNNGDTNIPHAYALNTLDKTTGKINADQFKENMEAYCHYLTHVESACLLEKIEKDPKFAHEWNMKAQMLKALFNTDDTYNEDGAAISWQRSTFDEMPAGAVLALLTKYQSDIRMAENELINFMFNAAGSSDFVVNSVTPVILPTYGEYVMQGQRYRARILSAMVDTNQVPRVFINGQEWEGGVYDIAAGGVGAHSYKGYMQIGDDTTHYEFEGKYTVGAPSATISNTDLNIMYIGYDNKFSVSVPGVADSKVRVSCNGASVKKEGALWIIKPNGGTSALIEVQAEVDGRWVSMGKQEYRIKTLPKPNAYFIAPGKEPINDGKIARGDLLNASSRLEASYGPDGLIQAKFNITGFSVKLPSGKEININGTRLDKKTLDALKGVKQGQMVTFRYIKAVGPDGKTVSLSPIPLELQ
ncbi:MAG: gliding motility protein GldM [Paludibacteraceae bacterium]|nr:gliding motility protein GldM [Paludibacteraceae bacterium]